MRMGRTGPRLMVVSLGVLSATGGALGGGHVVAPGGGPPAAPGAGGSPAPLPPAIRDEIAAVLSSMASAAVRGDAGGFLEQVDFIEPQFEREMRNMAKDLTLHAPVRVEFRLAESGSVPSGAGDRAHVAFTIDYDMPFDKDGRKMDASSRHVQSPYPVCEFRRDAGGAWRFAGEVWKEIPGDGFVVRYLDDKSRATAEIIDRVFPIAKAHDDEGFGIAGTAAARRQQVIKLYENMEHLKATVYLSMPDPVLGGWNESGESIKFMSSYTEGEQSWTRAFAHEYGHVATWALGDRASELPWWVAEGAAELAAEKWDAPGGNDRQVRGLAKAGKLAAWNDIANYHDARQEVKYLAYVQGHHLMGYVSDTFGREKRNAWIASAASGKSIDEATRAALGMSFDELDRAWRDSLKGERK
ncbi:MAG: peptidase MA family metallohydrolase [Phycisphaerales bacterium]